MGLIAWMRASAQKRRDEKAAKQAEYERLRELCRQGHHQYETISEERQGDGDPNIEGYIWVTTERCRICGNQFTSIIHEDDLED